MVRFAIFVPLLRGSTLSLSSAGGELTRRDVRNEPSQDGARLFKRQSFTCENQERKPMPADLTKSLVIGISSRALFNLEQANVIYDSDGLAAYATRRLELSRLVGFPMGLRMSSKRYRDRLSPR
jgi:hypothetical protein